VVSFDNSQREREGEGDEGKTFPSVIKTAGERKGTERKRDRDEQKEMEKERVEKGDKERKNDQ
jgi:hypothetical protein